MSAAAAGEGVSLIETLKDPSCDSVVSRVCGTIV